MRRRPSLLLAAAVAVLVVTATPAAARTELGPEHAVAGATAALTSHVAHEGAGTTSDPGGRATSWGGEPDPDASPTATSEPSTATSRALPGTTLEAANDGDGDAAAPWLIGAGIAAAVSIAVGGYLLKRRMG